MKSIDQKDCKYDKGGKLLESKGAQYKYDSKGNLVEENEKDGNIWRYEWTGMLSKVATHCRLRLRCFREKNLEASE